MRKIIRLSTVSAFVAVTMALTIPCQSVKAAPRGVQPVDVVEACPRPIVMAASLRRNPSKAVKKYPALRRDRFSNRKRRSLARLARTSAASGSCIIHDSPPLVDCNHNGIADSSDIANHTSQDINVNGVPDECTSECDTSLASGLNFQQVESAILNTADLNSDGIKWVCIANGAQIINPMNSNRGAIQISGSNVYLYAKPSSGAAIFNLRTDTSAMTREQNNSALILNNASNFRLSNIAISTYGAAGHGLQMIASQAEFLDHMLILASGSTPTYEYSSALSLKNSSTVLKLSNSNISSTGRGGHAAEFIGASVGEIKDVWFSSSGENGFGLYLKNGTQISSIINSHISADGWGVWGLSVSSGSTVGTIDDLNVSTTNHYATAIGVSANSQIGGILNSVITTTGDDASNGVVATGPNSTSMTNIGFLYNVSVQTQGTYNAAIRARNGAHIGPIYDSEVYVQSSTSKGIHSTGDYFGGCANGVCNYSCDYASSVIEEVGYSSVTAYVGKWLVEDAWGGTDIICGDIGLTYQVVCYDQNGVSQPCQ